MNISLPETLHPFIDQQIDARGFANSSECVYELSRKDLDRQTMRALMLAGTQSAPHVTVDKAYFAELRERIAKQSAAHDYDRKKVTP